MMHAVHHFAPIVGIDLHLVQPPGPVPPLPVPHPHVGMVMDVMDYLPNPIPAMVASYKGAPSPPLGPFATVQIGPFKRAQAGTAGVALPPHLPIGGMFTMPIGNESEAFMGSSTVSADGDAMSYLALPALSCQSIGMPPIPRIRPAKTSSLVLPTSIMLPVPFGVFVGGSPTISLMALGMRVAFGCLIAGLGVALRRVRKFRKARATRLRQNGCCGKVGEPVDVVTGANENYYEDARSADGLFVFRRYYSTGRHREQGPFGFGFRHEYQHRLRLRPQAWVYESPAGEEICFEPLTDGLQSSRAGDYSLRQIDRGWLELRGPADQMFEFDVQEDEGRLRRIRSDQGQLSFDYVGPDLNRVFVESVDPSVTDSTYELLYDANRRIVELRCATANGPRIVMRYEYDTQGDLVASADARDATTRYRYDRAHRWTRVTDARGYSFEWRYDSLGRCIRTWGQDGLWWTELAYFDTETQVAERGGGVWTYRYDANGTITEIIDPYGGVKKRVVADEGRVLEEVDAGGRTTKWLYEGHGVHVGRVDRFGYLSRTEREEPRPADPLERIPPTTPQDWTFGAAEDRLEAFRFSELSPILAGLLTPERGAVSASNGREHYDECGRLIARDEFGRTESFGYDETGNLVARIDRDRSAYTRQITSWNLVGAEIEPTGERVRYEYNATEQITKIIDASANTFHYEYDEKDRLVAVYHGARLYEAYCYDRGDRLIEKRDGYGNVLFTQEFGADSLVKARHLANRETHHFEHGADGQIIHARTDTCTVTMSWTGHNTIESDRRDGRGVEHDRWIGWLEATTILDRYVTRYQYDPEGREIGVFDPTGRRHTIQCTTEPGLLRSHAHGSCELRVHSADGQLLDRVCWSKDRTGRPRHTRYEYSEEGDLVRVMDSQCGVREYQTDASHRLEGVTTPAGTIHYQRDAAGNLIHKPDLEATTIGSHNRLIFANREEFKYDHRGSLVARVRQEAGEEVRVHYAYDALGQLTAIERSGSGMWAADYDPLGRRIRTISDRGDREFLWDQDRLAAEVMPTGKLRVYVYPPSDTALVPMLFVDYDSVDADPQSGRVYVLFTDQVGMPEWVKDALGNVVWSATQPDPYGPLDIDPSSSIELNLRWPGHYYDPETGLQYNRFRYYDPELGRYLTCDPSGQSGGLNLYAYVTNPMVDVDLLGLHGKVGRTDANLGKLADGTGRPTVSRPGWWQRLFGRRPQAKADDAVEAVAVARREARAFVLKLQMDEAIELVGDETARKAIERDLVRIASTKTGRKVLEELRVNVHRLNRKGVGRSSRGVDLRSSPNAIRIKAVQPTDVHGLPETPTWWALRRTPLCFTSSRTPATQRVEN